MHVIMNERKAVVYVVWGLVGSKIAPYAIALASCVWMLTDHRAKLRELSIIAEWDARCESLHRNGSTGTHRKRNCHRSYILALVCTSTSRSH
jgi:hypothetical protein